MFGGSKKEMLNENSLFEQKVHMPLKSILTQYDKAIEILRSAVNGILFNHESPQRGETFVTRKFQELGRIYHGLQTKLTLGNLDASRDWGYAGDYVEGMWMMLQHDVPDDWVLATGETHTVKEYLTLAFEMLDLDWEKYVLTREKTFDPTKLIIC